MIQFKIFNLILTFEHNFKVSNGGYVHIPILSFSYGKNGFAIFIARFSFAIAW